jgi:hypothetical protein
MPYTPRTPLSQNGVTGRASLFVSAAALPPVVRARRNIFQKIFEYFSENL